MRITASLFTGALVTAGFASATPARADDVTWKLPTGSYTKTCNGIHFSNKKRAFINAFCGTAAAHDNDNLTSLNVIYCKPGSVGNYDGNLKCDHDEANGTLYYSLLNRSALESAAVIVIGRSGSDADKMKWMTYALAQGDAAPAIKDGSWQFSDAALILRRYLTQASYDERDAVVKAAYQQAFGKPMTGINPTGTTYTDNIKAGKSWYSTLVYDFKHPKPSAPAPQPTGPSPEIH